MQTDFTSTMRLKKMLFSFSRISCIEYMGLISFWSAIMCLVLFEAFFVVTLPTITGSGDSIRDYTHAATFIILLVGSLVVMINFVLIAIRRLHDCGYSGWWWLLSLIPGVGLILGVILLLVPGSKKENRFGQPPLKANWFNYSLLLLGPIVFAVLILVYRSVVV